VNTKTRILFLTIFPKRILEKRSIALTSNILTITFLIVLGTGQTGLNILINGGLYIGIAIIIALR
jgi:hypothetical protein